jgi:large conductance mechanosensitive channel
MRSFLRPPLPKGFAVLKGFRDFIFRGNVIDLAVAVVVGTAFNAVVAALVKDLITPLIAAVLGKPNFAALSFYVHGSRFLYGDFLNALVSFLTISAVVYYVIVAPIGALTARLKAGEAAPVADKRVCPECLSEIPLAARRCAFCTATITG